MNITPFPARPDDEGERLEEDVLHEELERRRPAYDDTLRMERLYGSGALDARPPVSRWRLIALGAVCMFALGIAAALIVVKLAQ